MYYSFYFEKKKQKNKNFNTWNLTIYTVNTIKGIKFNINHKIDSH